MIRKITLILCILQLSYVNGQIAAEANIPLTLDTDGDTIANIIDTDDDNDGVLDNMDAFPLDNTKTTALISTTKIIAQHDAGCRNNGSNGGKNFGTEATSILDNGSVRYQILKFTKPSISDIISATLIINSNTENDPLSIYYQADNNWVEGSTNNVASNGVPPNGITFTSNNTNFTNKVFLGTTNTPTGTAGNYRYTFSIPLSSLPSSGDFTLIILDNTNDGTQESVYSKETAGKADTVIFNYLTPVTPRLEVIQISNDTTYLLGGSYSVGFKLLQAPTSTVYIPLQISDTTKASISGDKVLVFTTSNWNTQQVKTINALSPGNFDILIRPLHSSDAFYNGFNNEDLLHYYNQATNITNLGPWTALTNTTFSTTLNAVSAVSSASYKYKLITAPTGMGIVENSGKITFKPLSAQVGTYPVKIEVTDDKGNVSYFNSSITVTSSGLPDPSGIWVVPNGPAGGTGTAASPYNNIATAVSAASGGGKVFIRGGEYDLSGQILISSSGTATKPIEIIPAPGESVKLNFASMSLFNIDTNAKYVHLKNLEIDGGTDNVDFWCLVSNAFWGDATIPRGGGLAIIVDGEYITIQGNYIHNCYQKAIEIGRARYLKAYDNIIHSIATTSLSGGHGIMRQQKGGEIFTNDLPINRWDLNGNLIFNVEQRIYSWVPAKGYIDMVLDEGKPILIDDPKDSDGIQETMKANIENNVVAFGSIDQIRLKSTPNLTVKNNTVYSASPAADGITDKVGDSPTPQFTNTKIQNNAVQTMPGTAAFEMGDIVNQGNTSPNTPPTISGNYAAVGNKLPGSLAGITTTTNDLFVDPNNGNFRIKTSLGLPTTLGVVPAVLDSIDARVAKFGVIVKWDRWDNDHLKLTQTILDNIPGVNDGITSNETVFPDAGTLFLNTLPTRSEIHFNVIAGTAWKAATGAPSTENFELHTDYAAWYKARNAATKNNAGTDYARIRWGNSFTKQDQVFQNTWLTNCQITAVDSNTVIYSESNKFTLDGDLLIDFEGHTPVPGNKWNLMKAGTIISANSGGKLFDTVKFEGATLAPSQYSLSIVSVEGGQAVQLCILNPNSPEISVKGNSLIVDDGDVTPSFMDSTDFGSTNTTITRRFKILNSGADTLKITSIMSSGINASDFVISAVPSFVKAGDSFMFNVLFNAASSGVKTATISINNNDANEAIYDFAIKATKTGGCTQQTGVITDTMYNTANDSSAFNCANWFSGTYPDSMVNIVIKSGAELTVKQGEALKVHNIFVENGGKLLMTGGELKVYGNLDAENDFNAIVLNSGKLTLSGTDDNVFGTLVSAFNVDINKPSGGVVFDGLGLEVKGHINFIKGIITYTTEGSLEISDGASSTEGNSMSFAACEVRKYNLDPIFVFPVGKGSKWARLEVSNASGGAWRCEYYDTSYTDTTTLSPLSHVSGKEYWDLEPDGPYTVDIKLYWEDAAWSGIDLTQPSSKLVVAHFNNSDWENEGNNAVLFSNAGTIQANGFSNFSPFTFGSLSPLIPLSILPKKPTNKNEILISTAIYPNPAKTILNILNKENDILNIELIDLSGKKVISTFANSDFIKLNVSNLNSGAYILKIIKENEVETHKIYIQHE